MLTELVKVLDDRKAALEMDLTKLRERGTSLRAELELLDREMAEKAEHLAAINSQSVKEYKVIWKSYTPPNPFPCPLCFVYHKKLSPLEPLPPVDDVALVKCTVCEEVFEIPIELLYA
jgi:hypothetical protein